jgi:hypothetical protein
MPTARAALSSHDAFLRGLRQITRDKRKTALLTTRFDDYVNDGGDARDFAGTIYLETATEFSDPDPKFYNALAVYDDATGRVPLSARDVKHHPGQRRVSTGTFVNKEYNPFKTRTEGRLGSVEGRLNRLDGAEGLLRQLAASELANTASRATVINLQQEFDDIKRGYIHLDAVDSDDPAAQKVVAEDRTSLDERFEKVYRAAIKLVEPIEEKLALHGKVIDDQNLQLGEHAAVIDQHNTMLREHDAVVTTFKSGSDSTVYVAFIALGVGIISGLIAFLIKLSIIIPDVTTTEKIRGVTVKMVHDYSQLNGFWPALLVGLLVGSIMFVIVCIAGFAATNRRNETPDDPDASTQKKYIIFKRPADEATRVSPAQPDHIGTVNSMFESDTKPVTARV